VFFNPSEGCGGDGTEEKYGGVIFTNEIQLRRRSTARCVCVEVHSFPFRRICRVANHRELLRVSVGGSEEVPPS